MIPAYFFRQNSFQFTPLREGRHARTEGVENGCYFNSRPSARGDARGGKIENAGKYFNSRPSARGDLTEMTSGDCGEYFNSRPSARGDFRKAGGLESVYNISIHAPPRGAT